MIKRHKTFRINKNLGLSLLQLSNKNLDTQNHTNRSEDNNGHKKKYDLSNLNFNGNLLIKLLKRTKYKNVSKKILPERKKRKFLFKNYNTELDKKRNRNHLSEKYRNIPGISKLKYLTEDSINDILKREEKTSILSIPLNLEESIIEKTKKIKSEYKSPFIINKKLSLNNNKINNNFRNRLVDKKYHSLNLNLNDNNNNNNLRQNPKIRLINNRLYKKGSKEKIFKKKENNFCIYNRNLNIKYRNTDVNINNNNICLYSTFLKKINENKCMKLYKPNFFSNKIIPGNKSITQQKTNLNKNYNRIIYSEISGGTENRRENIINKKRLTYTNIENSKNYNLINNIIEINKNSLLNRSSKIDRLLFNLENPSGCFEENVYTLRAGDKYISLKNQIIKQKNKMWKMNYINEKATRLIESQAKRYIFKLFSDKNYKKSNID